MVTHSTTNKTEVSLSQFIIYHRMGYNNPGARPHPLKGSPRHICHQPSQLAPNCGRPHPTEHWRALNGLLGVLVPTGSGFVAGTKET